METDPVNLAKMAVNKMKYKLFQAAYDPEAEKMAAANKSEKNAETHGESLLDKVKKKIPKIFNRGGEGYQQQSGKPSLPPPPKPKPTPTDQFIAGFTNTFNTFIMPVIIVFLCSLAGSIAANDAIGRSPSIRLVYFIYGTVPIFSPFVLIYYLFRYFMNTYPVWYNFLPLTTWQPDSSFLKTILKPFIYSEDANTKYMFQQFDKAAKKWVDGGVADSNSNNTNSGTGGTGGTGAANNKGNNSATNSKSNGSTGASNAKGPTGASNATGATGTSNAKGPTGASNATGPTGASNATGPTGASNATGPTGSINATGPSGI